MSLWLSLNKAISIWPERQAIVDGEKRFTYKEFGFRVANLAKFLRESGLKKGDCAAIASPNCHEFLEVYYACAILGIVLAPLNWRLSEVELAAILKDADVKLLFIHQDFATSAYPEIEQIIWINAEEYEPLANNGTGDFPELPNLSNDDLAHLYYTSGTTGRPKGVMLTHGNVMFNALGAVAELDLKDKDSWIHAAPLFHLADAWSCFAMTWVGGKHVFLPQFHPTKALEIIAAEDVTVTVLVPTMLNAMLNDENIEKFDYSSLRLLITGGSPIAPETVRRLTQTFNCEYIQLYGLTETSPFLTVSRPKFEHRDLSEDQLIEVCSRTGRPFIAAEVRVVRDDGSDVLKNNSEVGEIIARGPTVTSGYWKQPEATAQAIRDGWFHTGDLAVIDEHGYINIVDRSKDMIISGGENIYSTEVEYCLYEHPAVLECAVIGVPDQHWGETVKAIVVIRPGQTASETELIDFVRTKLARYKAPRSVDFLKELPKTGSGKIYKKGLRELFWKEQSRQVN